MDKYEYRLKAEQIEKLVKSQDYETAAELADTVDWHRVKNLNMLYIVGEIYEKMERYEDCMEILYIAYNRAPVGRMLLYKMTDIATRMRNFEEAISLYQEFVKLAPHDQSRYILKYRIYRERGSSLEDQIKILREYKTHEYQEKWAYELASLYAQAGMQEECVRECDELILWFSEGEYVIKAMELKMQYEDLTLEQQEKYDHRMDKETVSMIHEDDFEEPAVHEFSTDKYSTMDLQAELAANLDELFKGEQEIVLEDLTLPETPEDLKEPKLVLEELALPEEPESVPEDMSLPEEPRLVLEDLNLPEEPEPEPLLENLELPREPEPLLENLELSEECRLTAEEEAPEIDIPEIDNLVSPDLPKGNETVEEPVIDKQITGQMTIDEILAEWNNKKAETEAILEANAPKEQVRKERVKQETAELMRLISGHSGTLPEEVKLIMEEIDQSEKPSQEPETEDALPPETNLSEEPEEEMTFEDLGLPEEPINVKRSRVSGDTASMNMIQELERSLAAEVSEMAVNAGHLTKEQARLFAYFTSVKGMSQQLSVIFKGKQQTGRTSSSSGNVVITGRQGNGKTTLAIDIVKALQKQKRIEGKRLAKISGQKLNSKDIYEVLGKLKGGALVIESAGGLSDEAMLSLSLAMEGDTGGLLIILEDSADEIQRLFHKNKNFVSKFDYTIDIPVFTNDELVAFGKSYALEQEYAFDEFGILALYDRIGSRQTNDHLVTVAEVKDIIDGAIAHAEKGGIRHLLERMTKKSTDEFGNHLLREDDFIE
ncbi:MAG: hypothetical protein K1W25_09655 [Lachnospiraceae bacterium]